MTTINTIEDLIRLLDENPQWVEALRVRLLTRELIELPEKFAQFVEQTNQRFEAINRRFAGVDQRLDGIDQRLDGIDQRLDGIDQRLDGIDQRLDGIDLRLDGIDGRLDRVETNIDGIRADIGTLKGGHAQITARRQASIIAEDMGFTFVRTLPVEEIGDLIRRGDTSGVAPSDIRSFRLADLVLEARNEDGAACYVAVEISFTVNGRDTSRAVRNAGYLARFTGQPAFAAVAGVRLDDRIRSAVDALEVFWYEMDDEALEAE